jgi:hypothetical protein
MVPYFDRHPSHDSGDAQHSNSVLHALFLPAAVRDQYEESWWEVLGAHDGAVSENHPDVVFREIREQRNDRGEGDESSWWWRRLWTRVTATSGEESVFVDGDSKSVEDMNSTTTSSGFDVTAETEYNVSDTVQVYEDGKNQTEETEDQSTVVYTTNEQINATDANETSDADTEGSEETMIGGSIAASESSGSSEEETLKYRPIRIRAFLSDITGGGQHLSLEQRNALLQKMIRPALLSWSAALRVIPVQGNLTVDPHQLSEGHSCGPGGTLPGVVVPASHVTTGVPETDMIVYINLAFSNTNASSTEKYVPTNNTMATTSLRSRGGDGAEEVNPPSDAPQDADKGGGKDAGNTSSALPLVPKQECLSDYLAASAFCSTDQFDRPTAAILHLCINDSFFNQDQLQRNIMVTMHEIGHALGFNSVSLAHFRRPDGSPVTPRNEAGEVPLEEIECTGPHGQRPRAEIPLPSEEILRFRTVRKGIRVAEVVTPSVALVARNHFDCQELPGAELESGEFLPLSTNSGETACLGDHWERRLFKTDLMNPLVDDLEFSPRFSTITLAYFADSGWYQVDLSRASLAAGWGRAAGCEFVEEPCIDESGKVPPRYEQFFCDQAPSTDTTGFSKDIHGCSVDFSRKATCSLGRYEGELPPEYQYFSFLYGANVGGNDPYVDYCPVYSGFSNGLCSDGRNEAVIRVDRMERFGQRNSRCLSGLQLDKSRRSSRDNPEDSSSTGEVVISSELSGEGGETDDSSNADTKLVGRRTALCLQIACVIEDRSLRIKVDGRWEKCQGKGDVLEGRSGDVNVICPDPVRVCPTFYCDRDCLGTNRTCNYSIGKCVCSDFANATVESEFSDTTSIDVGQIYVGLCNERNGNKTAPNSNSLFYDPENETTASLPGDDSPLADYYVPTARNLKDDRSGMFNQEWKIVISLLGTVIAIAAAVLWYLWWRTRRGEEGRLHESGAQDDENRGAVTPNREKDKMIATVLLDMRINDPTLQQRADPLRNRDSETDVSMTETEGTCVVDLPAETGSQNSESIAFGMDAEDEIYVDPLAAPPSPSRIFRRRHVPAQRW